MSIVKNNVLQVPVLEKNGELSIKFMRNTLVGYFAELQGIPVPLVIKELRVNR